MKWWHVFLLVVFSLGISADLSQAQSPARKLQTIRIPSLEFSDAALHEAVTFLQVRSAELSGTPTGGVNFILNGGEEVREIPVSLNLQNVSLGQALWFLSELAQLDISIDQHAVVLSKAEKWARRPVTPSAADKAVAQKLNQIVVPGVEFSAVPLGEAIDLLRAYSNQLDTSEPDPEKRGVNFVFVPESGDGAEPEVSLKLTQLPLSQVLRYVVELSGFEARIEKGVVVIAPKVKAVATP